MAELAGLPDKATICALGQLHDAGMVDRIGCKYKAAWALSGRLLPSGLIQWSP